VEEQEWLEEHIPSGEHDHIHAGEDHPEPLDSDASTQHDPIDADDGLWGAARSFWQNRTVLGFVGGFFTCFIAVMFWWTGICLKGKIRRKRELQGYAKVNKEDVEDDYELDEGLAQANGNVDNG
jgi:hypothetical protein